MDCISRGVADDLFFVWAERAARPDQPRGSAQQVQRHPYAATTIEIADLLAVYVPDTDWRRAERLTRVALLPSTAQFPLMPRWLADDQEPDDAPPQFRLWRIEGIGIPILQIGCARRLAADEPFQDAQHRLGVDLRYWGLAAKFGLELLARERFLPGMRSGEGGACAVWLPVLDDAEDRARFDRLAQGMPPACRAVFRERARSATTDFSRPTLLLESFLAQLMDRAVRDGPGSRRKRGCGASALNPSAGRPHGGASVVAGVVGRAEPGGVAALQRARDDALLSGLAGLDVSRPRAGRRYLPAVPAAGTAHHRRRRRQRLARALDAALLFAGPR